MLTIDEKDIHRIESAEASPLNRSSTTAIEQNEPAQLKRRGGSLLLKGAAVLGGAAGLVALLRLRQGRADHIDALQSTKSSDDTPTRPQLPGEAATTRFGMEEGDNTDIPATGGPQVDADQDAR